eukprot:CAMPEP_0117538578 /NCGR_PEP_ID=MMETSP0784-20121206/42549_1 /TAXON_ID=39447 /ORGANISM="" /LENGTH=142 /DNA_ID=CAMNT_0005335193 /DNA_START=351 /DNA_END=776 /DNA_ORIENTATION=+
MNWTVTAGGPGNLAAGQPGACAISAAARSPASAPSGEASGFTSASAIAASVSGRASALASVHPPPARLAQQGQGFHLALAPTCPQGASSNALAPPESPDLDAAPRHARAGQRRQELQQAALAARPRVEGNPMRVAEARAALE